MRKVLFVLTIILFVAGEANIIGETNNKAKGKKEILSPSQKEKLIKERNRAFISMEEKVRDPFILLGPDNNYYLTGTTAGSHWGDTIGVKIWKSSDLCNWESLGFVWDIEKDGKDSWFFNRKPTNKSFKNLYAVWAPEVHFFNNTWWLTISRNGGGHGLLKSISGEVTGPYEETDVNYLKGIDSHLFEDNGHVYYAYAGSKLSEMNNDMLSMKDEDFTELKLPGKHEMGYEGVYIMKFEDKYLWIASGRYGYEPTNTYDLYYAVSDDLYEGYGQRRMMIKNAGHGNIFQDKSGNWWSTAFDHEYTDQWCCWLVPIELKLVDDDVIVEILDERFSPNKEDQDSVKKLSKTGIPSQWKGKTPWWRPTKN